VAIVVINNYRYYFSSLSSSQQHLYDVLYRGITSYDVEIEFPDTCNDDVQFVFETLLLENTDIFFLESFQFKRDLSNRKIMLRPMYRFSVKDIRQYNADTLLSLSYIQTQLKRKNDFEKVMYLHDFILNNIEYDYTFSKDSFSVLGVMKYKRSVCEGIAKYVKLALDYLSIKSIVVTGFATNPTTNSRSAEAHAWNMVEINGNWYHLDITFDLTLKHKINRYDYFLVKEDVIKRDHSFKRNIPSISTKIMDYYFVKSLIMTKPSELAELIYGNIVKGQNIMQFKLSNVGREINPSDRVLQIAQEQYQRLYNRSFSTELRYNASQWVYELEFL
jgi:hypothetical protein